MSTASTLLQSFRQPVTLKTALFVAAGLAAAVAWQSHNKPLTLATPPAYSIEAGALLMELRGNQAAAHLKYQGKVIEVTGPLRGVRMQGNTPVLTVGHMLAFNIDCHLSPDKTGNAARLQGGTEMRVRGVARVSGASVHLAPCIY